MILSALRSVGYGVSLRDKTVIAAGVATAALLPVGAVARRLGIPLADPRRWAYTVRGPTGVFTCPAGPSPYFLGVHDSYDPALCELIATLEGGTFIDVGASVGFVTARAARRCDRVIAIEPHPARFECLERNVQLNELHNVTCVRCAIGANTGQVDLYDLDLSLGPHPLDVSSTPGRGPRLTVPLRRLDDIAGEIGVTQPTVIKIDVEGGESEVLRGASQLLAERPTLVVESLGGGSLPELRALLVDYSFRQLDARNWLVER